MSSGRYFANVIPVQISLEVEKKLLMDEGSDKPESAAEILRLDTNLYWSLLFRGINRHILFGKGGLIL